MVRDMHLSRELLFAAFRGDLPARVMMEIALDHLENLCLPCRREIRAFYEELKDLKAGKRVASYQAALLLPSFLDAKVPWLREQQWKAKQDFRTLLAFKPDERLQKVERSRARFRGAELAKLLMAESDRHIHTDPEQAYHWADVSRLVLIHSPQLVGDFDLLALSIALMANARRAKGALREAEKHFDHVRFLIRSQGVLDLGTVARIDELEGSLRKDQRLFDDAQALLARAELLYQLTGETTGGIRALLVLASAYNLQGKPEEAIQATRDALRQMPRGVDRRLYLTGRYNLARYLTEAGQYQDATDLLARDEDLYREFPEPWTQLRLLWLRGKIAVGLGDLAAAEESFLQARQGFIEQGIGYDAAMVAVEDLALLYLRQGRTADVKRLAEEMLPIFQAQDVHREALAALVLFQEAARREELTAKQIHDLVKYLQDARHDPTLRFERPV